MKKNNASSDLFHKNLIYAVLIALLVGVIFLRSYFSLIVVSFILAYVFTPIYKRLVDRLKNKSTAATLTLLIASVSVLIPLIIVVAITIAQATEIANNFSSAVSNESVTNLMQSILDSTNKFLTNISGKTVSITIDDVWTELSSYATTIASLILGVLESWIGSIGSIITNVILFIYIFLAALIYKSKIIETLKMLNPLGDEVSELYLHKVGDMTKAMIRGQFIIAVCQGIASAIFLTIAGVPYFSFWVLLLSFMSLIPLGAGIVTIPIGIVLILMGEYWQGAVVIGGHLLVVTNIDNVLRPILVPKSVRLNSALLMLSVFAGLSVFGFLGIIVGPIIMILIITTLETYEKSYKSLQSKSAKASK